MAISENATTLAKPKIDAAELEPYSVDEIQRILTAARERRNAARRAIGLALGLRLGEVLVTDPVRREVAILIGGLLCADEAE